MPEGAQVREHLPLSFPATEAELDMALNACQVSHAALTDDWNAVVAAFGAAESAAAGVADKIGAGK